MNRFPKAFVLYGDEKYFNTLNACASSIRTFSDYPIIIYLINFTKKINLPNCVVVEWNFNFTETKESVFDNHAPGDNFYVKRNNVRTYELLTQKPDIVKHALMNYADVITFIDSDSVATPSINNIFEMYPPSSRYPYFTKGIQSFILYNNQGYPNGDDYTTTIEFPACKFLNINIQNRKKYISTNLFVAGFDTLEFITEWSEICKIDEFRKAPAYYAPLQDETLANCLLWKYNYQESLPYIYMNADTKSLSKVFEEIGFNGLENHIEMWLKIPRTKDELLTIHSEKRPKEMRKMVKMLKHYYGFNSKIKVLFWAPHLSTGGMPSFLLKRIESLKLFCPNVEIFVVEYSDFSPTYVVQKNMIKKLLPESHFWTLGEDKMELIQIIEDNQIDIVHIDEMIEGFEWFNPVSDELKNEIYSKDRTWKVVETCHNIWFNPKESKLFHPDAYALCSKYHFEETFNNLPSICELTEFPIEKKVKNNLVKSFYQKELGLDPTKIHVINVGLWTQGKNQGEAVEIARLLESSNPEYQFHFLGNLAVNFSDYWGQIINDLPKNVIVWGERNDVDKFMKASDILMFNSTWECNPITLKEGISNNMIIFARNLPQYSGVYDEYIINIDDDIENTKNKLLNHNSLKKNYYIPNNSVEEFAYKHYTLYEKLMKENFRETLSVTINQHFIGQPFFEVLGDPDISLNVKFFDDRNNLIYNQDIKSNHWVRLNRTYFTKWKTELWHNEKLIYSNNFSCENKRVYIAIDSKSLGDNVAWIPYCLEFKKKHNCEVIVSTFWNSLFEKTYPELKFVLPGTEVTNLYAMYVLGWFYDDNKEPELCNTVPLQKAATNILGLDYKEIKPNLYFEIKAKPFINRYVTIATSSTAGCKLWNNKDWQELINYLCEIGYIVVNVSKEESNFKNVIKIKDKPIDQIMNIIHHSEFFIGLGSGLSWLSWGLGKHVVMISNFSKSDHEFQSNCTRISNTNVCNGCWNMSEFKFDKGDWNWCPLHKNTERQFECQRSITSEMVINQIKELIVVE